MNTVLFDIAAAGGMILTANKRLARHLARQYVECQAAAGLSVWPTPSIMSLDAWGRRQFQSLDHAGTLLEDVQVQRVWEEIVAADALAAGRDLLQGSQAARRAREAHRLLSTYCADFRKFEADEDHLAFLRWRAQWRERQRAGGWLERADVLPAVTAALADGRCPVPGRLVLAGFDDLTPVVQQLCTVLEQCGCRVDTWEPPPVAGARAAVHTAVDMAAEVRACARWARLRLERNPRARIGVVAPNLPEYQGLVERVFRAELDPSSCLPGDGGPEAFSLSLGIPLAREGLVRAALRLLAVSDPLRLEDAGWLLRSPYLGAAQAEGAERARADRLLRERGRSEWRLSELARALAGAPRMARICERLREAAGERRRQLPGAWAESFAQLLGSCGWPGDRGLTSREYQACDHFKETLGQLASLDQVAQALPRGDAVAILARLNGEAIFQPEGSEGGIQVLGMLEAAGFSFDALWVFGLHDRAFPSPARPNPFIPLAVQSRLRMPHADAARERDFAAKLARRLFTSAPEVIVSWPACIDSAPQRPSPFLAGLPTATPELAESRDPFLNLLATPCVLEAMTDDHAAPLPGDRPFAGGTNILKDQALCPFRAFAHHRLHAERLESPDLGIDGMTRGSLVHGVLERFWRQIDSQAALLALDDARLRQLLEEGAEEALQQFERRNRCDIPRRLRQLESHLLVTMAMVWLTLERRRPPFRVAAIEQRHDARVGRLQLRTRIDRIDQLADGTLAVIDYKTGRPSPGQWLDARVTEPQLPLYCLDLDESRLGAVIFAMVRSREKECAFKGVAREPDVWPGMKGKTQEQMLAKQGWGSFAEVVAHWRKALPALGDGFVAGYAVVDPVDPRLACKYCDLSTLCRIGGRGDADADDAGEGGDHD